jgi:hypothetical protein
MQLHDVHYDRGVPDDTFTLANLSRGQ